MKRLDIFGRDKMLDAFELLNTKLAANNDEGEILLFGGAAMCLAFGGREYTRDVDALFEPKSDIYKLSEEVKDELNLPNNWLNDGVKGFIYTDVPRKVLLTLSNLKILVAAPEYVLAMKIHAAREDSSDLEDCRYLSKLLKLNTSDELLDLVEQFVPRRLLGVAQTIFVEEILNE